MLRKSRLGLKSMLAMLGICFSVIAARADAIDGRWCNGTEQVAIDGPTIITPAGTPHQGDYTRHTFEYVVPSGEIGAGDRIRMVQQSEELVHVQRTPKGADKPNPVEAWRRCANLS